MSQAMQAVKEGMCIRSASELYRIPALSLRDHLYGVTTGRKRGAKSVMSSEEEEQVVQWIFWLQQLGHPITLLTLRMKVAEICQGRETPFVEGFRDEGGCGGGDVGIRS